MQQADPSDLTRVWDRVWQEAGLGNDLKLSAHTFSDTTELIISNSTRPIIVQVIHEIKVY